MSETCGLRYGISRGPESCADEVAVAFSIDLRCFMAHVVPLATSDTARPTSPEIGPSSTRPAWSRRRLQRTRRQGTFVANNNVVIRASHTCRPLVPAHAAMACAGSSAAYRMQTEAARSRTLRREWTRVAQ